MFISIDACKLQVTGGSIKNKTLINDRKGVQPPSKTRKPSPQSLRSSNLCALDLNGDLARRLPAGKDILGGGEDSGPVLESGVGHATALAESHKI